VKGAEAVLLGAVWTFGKRRHAASEARGRGYQEGCGGAQRAWGQRATPERDIGIRMQPEFICSAQILAATIASLTIQS